MLIIEKDNYTVFKTYCTYISVLKKQAILEDAAVTYVM